MSNSAKSVVEEMFAAFSSAEVDRFVATLSQDTVWEYHGTHLIPKGTFKGKEGVRKFFNNIHSRTEMLILEPQEYFVEGSRVVVLGHEHQLIKRSGRQLKQKWVQIFSIENNLITSMEEFATSQEVTN